MIYLIGAGHDVQDGSSMNRGTVETFNACLETLGREKKLQVVAEEANEEALKCRQVAKTIPLAFAVRLGLPHVFVDPDSAERLSLGIKSRGDIAQELGIVRPDGNYSEAEQDAINQAAAPYDRLREREWLRRLKPFIDRNSEMVFVCGFGHISSLQHQFAEQRISYKNMGEFK